MKSFEISLGRGIQLDVLKAIETRVGICANSGAGKSHLMRLIVEKIAGRVPCHIIDHEGEYPTVRSKVDAVLVGRDGDMLPQVGTAHKLAQKLLAAHVSTILDVSALSRVDRLNFVAAYIEGLLDAPSSAWHPTFVFVDEAHRWAPEVASKGGGKQLTSAIQRCRAAVIALMDSGRKRSIGGVIATQRLAKVTKDAFAEANNLFSGRFAQDTDLKRVSELLGLDHKQRDLVPEFEAGEFLGQGPALNKPGTVKFRTYDTKTKAPRFGDKAGPSQPSASVKKLLSELVELPQEVETEVRDLADARKEVTRLQRELKRAQRNRAKPSEEAIHAAESNAVAHERKRISRSLEAIAKKIDKLPSHSVFTVATECVSLAEEIRGLATGSAAPDPQPRRKKTKRPSARSEKSAMEKQRPRRSNGALPMTWSSAPGRLLTVLLQFAIDEPISKRRLAALAGVSQRKTSTFRNAMSTLKTEGLIEVMGSDVSPSASALEFMDEVEPLPSGEQLIDEWRDRLGGGAARRIFDALLEVGGVGERDEISVMADVDDNTSSMRNALSELRRLGLVESGRGSEIQAAAHVMEAIG